MEFKILIYTDYDQIDESDDPKSWSIRDLKKFVGYKTRTFGEFIIERRYRFESKSEHLRLTPELLSQYHELWVLCFNTVRMDPYQLDAGEVEALLNWMNSGGGLLVAGDHGAGFCYIDDPKTFETYGKSLGEPMKRAGQLRNWKGPPTACIDGIPLEKRDNYNTCEGNNPEKLDDIRSQSDASPAKLLKPVGEPHSLFIQTDISGKDRLIERFPDHPHESSLIELKTLDGDWPKGSSLPVTAARARDKRFPKLPREYPLVIAWDGPAQYGRIVADSSFHHYLNINLAGIPKKDSRGLPVPKSHLDQIATYYGNLAIWLLPRDERNRMKLDLFYRLAVNPDVFEVKGTGFANLGRAAQYVMNEKWEMTDLHWFIRHTEPDHAKDLDNLLAAIFFPDHFGENLQTTVLGSVVHAYHSEFAAQGAITPDWLEQKPDPLEMIGNAIQSIIAIEPAVGEKLRSLLQNIS